MLPPFHPRITDDDGDANIGDVDDDGDDDGDDDVDDVSYTNKNTIVTSADLVA